MPWSKEFMGADNPTILILMRIFEFKVMITIEENNHIKEEKRVEAGFCQYQELRVEWPNLLMLGAQTLHSDIRTILHLMDKP